MISQKKFSFWRKKKKRTGSCFAVSTRTFPDEREPSKEPHNAAWENRHINRWRFPTMQKTPKCFSILSGSDCKYRAAVHNRSFVTVSECLETIVFLPIWRPWCGQNGPVVPGKHLLWRITPNHTATGDALRWFDPFMVILTLYRLAHLWKFTPTCVHVWLAKLGHMVTWTEVCRYSQPRAI